MVLTLGVGAVLLGLRDGSEAVATDAVVGAASSQAPAPNAESPAASVEEIDEPTPFLSMEWMDVSGGPEGTERVVLVFDRDLPEVPIRFVDDVAYPEPSAVSFATQGAGDEGVRVCDGIHWFPGAATGSVDVLLPGDWFEPGSESYLGRYRADGDPAKRGFVSKIPICMTKNGFIQISVWGPASGNPADVSVSLEGNTITLVIEPAVLAFCCELTTSEVVNSQDFGRWAEFAWSWRSERVRAIPGWPSVTPVSRCYAHDTRTDGG